MNRKLVKKWVRYLRSGKYKQGTDQLVDKKQRYCCLGVAICAKTSRRVDYKSKQVMNGYYGVSNYYLSKDFRNELGLSNKLETKLANMNDSNKYSFAEIADYIEKVVLKKKGKK